MSQERKSIAVNKAIAEKILQIAKNEGMTLFSLINEVLQTSIYLYETKLGKFSDIVSQYENLMIAKDVNMIFIPLKLTNLVHKWAFETEGKEELLREWYNYGKWIANYSKVRFPGKELITIGNVSKDIFWHDTEFKINKIPEEQNPKEIEVRIFGKILSEEYIECISQIYEGLMNEFGFKTAKKNISEGICYLKFKIE